MIAHAGTGSALAVLEAGKAPVLVPRERLHGEHVDDHQRQIGEELARRGLARCRSVAELSLDDLWLAASERVERVAPPPLRLGRPVGSEPAPGEDAALPVGGGRFDRERQPAGARQRRKAGL